MQKEELQRAELQAHNIERRLPFSPLGLGEDINNIEAHVTNECSPGSSTNGRVMSDSGMTRPRPLVACVTPTPQVEQGLLSPTPLVRTPLADISGHQAATTPRIPLAELDSTQLSQRLFHSPAPSLSHTHPSPSASMCQTSPSHLLHTQVGQSVAANQSRVSHNPGANQHRERRHQLNTERQFVELRQQVEHLSSMMGEYLLVSRDTDIIIVMTYSRFSLSSGR